jgi:hypothetical protein
MPKSATAFQRVRYSIGEWYGQAFEKLTAAKRRQLAKVELEVDALTGTQCPFQHNSLCNKKGGVCSLRLYGQTGSAPSVGSGHLITTCPSRFLEKDIILGWVGETILGSSAPIVLGEIGFLDRIKVGSTSVDDESESQDLIGRIDNVLVHPSQTPLNWCALELQAVYFSGGKMRKEFQMLKDWTQNTMPFPAGHRRPDWRSSGPKRLLPQLQTKVPTIRTWGKKMAVVIDEAFFESLIGLDAEKHLSNAEIAWFVVKYDLTDDGWQLKPRKVVYTRLDSSVKALTGGLPLSKEQFEQQLRSKLATAHLGHPLTEKPR